MRISERWQLIKPDVISIAKGALINFAGALALYVADYLGQLDFGANWWTPLATAGAATGVNIIRKWALTTEYR